MEWIIFGFILVTVLFIDLGLFHKEGQADTLRVAVIWSLVWIVVSLLFGVGIWVFQSTDNFLLYLTGYLVEKSLSVDNLFLFLVIFKTFSIKREYQHKILFWGILGAVVTRGLMIWAGVSLIEHYSWITYVFGLFIIYVGIKTATVPDDDFDVSNTFYYKFIKKILPIKWDYEGSHFAIVENGKLFFTPLLVVLFVVEISDVLFALDSVPAILSITTDPFLVFTSNLFAILGLRALYFVLAEMVDKFTYLSHGVSAVLILVGVKILLKDFVDFPELLVLVLIFTILIGSVVFSIWKSKQVESRSDLS